MPKLLQAFRNMLTEVPIILVFSIFVAMLLNQNSTVVRSCDVSFSCR